MPREYAVGYGKPPVHSRFQKGRSGNPKGRPKGTRNLKTDLLEELSEPILIREGERQVRTTKQRALVKSLIAKALKGDMRAMATLITLSVRLFGMEEITDDASAPLSVQEQEQLAVLEARFLRRMGGAPDELPARSAPQGEASA
jgi:hypothetical protein